ncbi:MAG: right-handed parallel beta-helix repeat-containing protein [Thermodesulfobacteriota bacterium]
MADLRIQYMEEMVGAGHPAKSDTLNRLMLSEHGINGAHKWFDVTHPDFGAKGDGVTDDTSAIQAAFDAIAAAGGIRTVYFPSGTYLISAGININKNNITVRGEGESSVIQVKNNVGDLQFNGYGAMFLIATGSSHIVIKDLLLDGNSDNNTASTYSAIEGTNTDNLSIRDMTIKNTPFNAILLTATTLPHTNFKVTNNKLLNIGWQGIQVRYGDTGIVSGNNIFSSGNHGIVINFGSTAGTHSSSRVVVSDNIINRSVPPSTILTGQVESGMMIMISEASSYIVVDSNVCYDNRNAANDGIATVGSPAPGGAGPIYRSIVISNNSVSYAGGFGIDATSHCTVTGNVIMYPATDGIVLSGDLGPMRKDVLISNNVIYNPNFSNTPGTAGIALNSAVNNGATWKHIRITNNIVFDEAGQVLHGVLVNATNMLVRYIEISGNDLNIIGGLDSIHITNPGNVTNLRVRDNVEKNLFRIIANGDATPSVLGAEYLTTANTTATTITMFNDGYVGQRIFVRIGDNLTTIDFTGTNLKGNGGVNYAASIGSTMDCVFDGTQWGCTVNKA